RHALRSGRWHPATECANATAIALGRNEWPVQTVLLRDIFGPLLFRPITLDAAWLTLSVRNLAEAIDVERDFERLPILGDALEEAGCSNADWLALCRRGGEHVRGCWVVDLVGGKT